MSERIPAGFLDFINYTSDSLPLLIYKADELPTCHVLERGSDGGRLPDPADCSDVTTSWSWDARYIMVLTSETAIPGRWLNKLERVSIDWIRVVPDSIKTMVASTAPHLCIWRYHDGPRPWCQHGGDEDWTVVMKKCDYEEERYGRLAVDELGNCIHSAEEGEFSVITAAHA